jgi:UDP-N-acetylmuramoyl-L-alanyl-D-glutamate--2,6-diaminopimelate ligase
MIANSTISEIIFGLNPLQLLGKATQNISALSFDSREAKEGFMFFAIKGTVVDGHTFISQVITNGCTCIVCEVLPQTMEEGVCYIQVANTQAFMGLCAANFYQHPSKELTLVAITGTNGKTTVATLLFNLFRSLGYSVGLLSTVQNQINEDIIPATHTTPDSIKMNALLRQMVEEGCSHCFMEASSHAIHQNRIKGLHFAGIAFTNITHDHLDYHVTFDAYIKAKKQLFDEVNADAFALTNKDDKNGLVMLQNTRATRYTYGVQQMADFKAKIMESDFNGMLLNIDGEDAWFRLVGNFNAYNLLLVYGVALLLGEDKYEIITHLSKLSSVKGRFDYVRSTNGIIGIIDYAHTPDALKNVLETINEVRNSNETLYTVIGCGGNRDAAKRPIMAEVACNLSSKVILTSDNPRNEDPEQILNEMAAGVPPLHFKKTLRITDRREAIKTAVSMANKGDIILVAGKGHENYQEVKGVKHPFDDKLILQEFFQLFQS